MDINKEKFDFDDLKEIIAYLRSENGCPWDKEQTHESLRKNLIEESYEFIHEAETNSKEGMCEELGDVLLQVMLHSQIATDDNEFTIDDVIDGIAKKMIFRHPHVFGEEKAENSEEALKLFKGKKEEEKNYKNVSDELGRISEDLPALIRSYKLSSKLYKASPEYFSDSFEKHIDKVYEELHELEHAYEAGVKDEMEDELGDVLNTVVFLGKVMDIDSEIALNKNFNKVQRRIKIIEENLLKDGEKITSISPETLKEYWEKSKKSEK